MLALLAVLVATNVWHAFGGPGGDAVSFACHIGGFVAGTAMAVLARVRGIDLRRPVVAKAVERGGS
jgi:membrane associated rhomboid family serine protease